MVSEPRKNLRGSILQAVMSTTITDLQDFFITWSKKTQGFAFWLDNQKIKTAPEMNRLQFDLISLEYING